MVAVADACFDLASLEASGARGEPAPDLRRWLLGAAGADQLLGVVGKCQIPGCDVHLMTIEQEVVRHLAQNDSTPTGFSDARSYWEAPHDGVVAVVVYADRMDAVLVDGGVVPIKKGAR